MPKKKLIIIMGVSGSGKTTIAKHISANTPFKYLESDDFHSLDNKHHMQSGMPLTDEMRWPWIQSIGQAIEQETKHVVLANSGLKSKHREYFRTLDRECYFVNLRVPYNIILNRLEARAGHFMPSSLLTSQFEDMEQALPHENFFELDGNVSISEMTATALACVQEIHKDAIENVSR